MILLFEKKDLRLQRRMERAWVQGLSLSLAKKLFGDFGQDTSPLWVLVFSLRNKDLVLVFLTIISSL